MASTCGKYIFGRNCKTCCVLPRYLETKVVFDDFLVHPGPHYFNKRTTPTLPALGTLDEFLHLQSLRIKALKTSK